MAESTRYSLTLVEWLWVLSVTSQLFAAILHYKRGLIKVYPFWSVFLIASATCSVLLMGIGSGDPRYNFAWAGTNSFTSLLLCAVIYEALTVLWRQYPQIGRHSRLAAGACAIAAIFAFAVPNDQWHYMRGSALQAGVCLVIFIRKYLCLGAALVLSLSWWAVFRHVGPALSSNVRRHGALLTAYCATSAALYWARTNGFDRNALNIAMTGIPAVLYLVWALSLSAEGEQRLSVNTVDGAAEQAKSDYQQFINNLRVLRQGIQKQERD